MPAEACRNSVEMDRFSKLAVKLYASLFDERIVGNEKPI
jgi:hypothetical protein